MTAKDILCIVKDHLEDSLKQSQVSNKTLEELFPEAPPTYLNGFLDGVTHNCEELLDLITALTK